MFNLLNFFHFADTRVNELADKLQIIGQCKGEVDELLGKREMLSRETNQRALIKSKRADYVKEVSQFLSNFVCPAVKKRTTYMFSCFKTTCVILLRLNQRKQK